MNRNRIQKIINAMVERKLIDERNTLTQVREIESFSDEALDSFERFVMKQNVPEQIKTMPRP